MLAEPEGVAAAIALQIETYGYRVTRYAVADGLPASPVFGPEAVIIEARGQSGSLMARVRAGMGLPGGPAVVVIDQGLEPVDRILVLEAGADDCILWPCSPRELVARLHAIARRRRPFSEPEGAVTSVLTGDMLAFGPWTIDRAQRRLIRPGASTEILPVAEFAVLDQLLRQPRKIVSREALLEATAPGDAPETRNLRAIDIQVSRLRKRLEIDGDELIRTVRGRGYMLLPPVTPG
ncbi:response regulator transcription factor [Sphingomonas sp. CGMCC 1.13654]|uniref:Response regulator transcription factor n=1 Tax=Sphingomonas chungangi TaxID=2683589 RepID=A0A838LBD3_9SPHN|nr:response regulator transcription factor [Sphingomonas chungangi]MVW54590.1 DNA-binding response regulator [Sphingomonas chungangi]